jgi:hypothetical protein
MTLYLYAERGWEDCTHKALLEGPEGADFPALHDKWDDEVYEGGRPYRPFLDWLLANGFTKVPYVLASVGTEGSFKDEWTVVQA